MVIQVIRKSSYGNEYIYPLTNQRELETLTKQKTLTKANIEALKALGITFELKQDKV